MCMKKLSSVTAALLLLSCLSINRALTATTAGDAKRQASVEYGCPLKKIKLIEKTIDTGGAIYSLDVCGTRRVYTQTGSTLQEKK